MQKDIMKKKNTPQGFTLIEILLVVAAIAILAGIVILAINPSKQLGDTRNADRRTAVTTILNAVYQYSLDNNGSLPSSISSTTPLEICATGVATTTCASEGFVDLSMLTLNERYLTAIPSEPQKTEANGAGYMIKRTTNNRVTVDAQFEEDGEVISVTR